MRSPGILPGSGHVSREQANAIAYEHYAAFEERRRAALEEEALKQLTDATKKLPGREKK